MNTELKKTISIQTNSIEEMHKVRDALHSQLVGKDDYIESRVVLNCSEETQESGYIVNVFIFEDCVDVPELII